MRRSGDDPGNQKDKSLSTNGVLDYPSNSVHNILQATTSHSVRTNEIPPTRVISLTSPTS
jgi:hypothetical protein